MNKLNPSLEGVAEKSALIRNSIHASLLNPPVFGLASLVGSSPQTSILTAEALRPQNLLLLSTSGVADSVRTIREWFDSQNRGWVGPTISVAVCDPIDPNSMADAVTLWVNTLDSRSSTPCRLVIDATGGKKSMSVAAGMIASIRGLEVVYIDSQFDPATRKPRPGSEQIVLIPRVTIR